MAQHRVLLTRVRRGVAKWPVVLLIAATMASLSWLGWEWTASVLQPSASTTAPCPQGNATLRVATSPALSEPLRTAAQNWMTQRPVVYDQCIRLEVQAVDPATLLNGLTKGWAGLGLSAPPTAWLVESTQWTTALSTANPDLIGTPPASIAVSPTTSGPFFTVFNGSWISPAQSNAAQQFQSFLKEPAQQRLLSASTRSALG